jgi:hypothetical protein
MNDSLPQEPVPTGPETRTLQDFTKFELQTAIVDAAERLRAETDEDAKRAIYNELSDAIHVVNSKFPTYGPDPSDGKLGARSDLDDLRLPEQS